MREGRLLATLLVLLMAAQCGAQYTDQAAFEELGGAQEFAQRRAALAAQLKTGVVLLFARTALPEAGHYREDNDFYYFTGVAEPGAVLMMDLGANETLLFVPEQNDRIKRVLGPNVLAWRPERRSKLGIEQVLPLRELDLRLADLLGRGKPVDLWLRLGYPDRVDGARREVAREVASFITHLNHPDPPAELAAVRKLAGRFPVARQCDLTPVVDALRDIKRPSEIAILRRNGKISAAGHRRAMARAYPGIYQYQVEAEAAYLFRMQGAQGVAYPAIVGSGENITTWHYFSNRNRIEDGELVVFDYGADLHQLTIDITRTFPVNGKFTPEQAKWYRVQLEAQKAVIAALKPGNTYEQAGAEGKKIFEKHGVGHMWSGTIAGHTVGMAVHDVLGTTGPVKAGQVVTVEPIIEFPDKRIHIRIEDTVLITENGPEVLSADAPKELEEVERLVGSEARK